MKNLFNLSKRLSVKIESYFKNILLGGIFKYNEYHLYAFGYVAIFAHPIFWFWWTYVSPQPYESPTLRTVGFVSCVTLVSLLSKKEYFKKVIPLCWIFVVVYNLPFFFTVNLIKNHLIDTWLMAEVIMIFVVILFIPNTIFSLLVMLLGVGLAVAFTSSTELEPVYPVSLLIRHAPLYLLSIIAGHIFLLSNILGIKAQEEAKKEFEKAQQHQRDLALAGGIAHDVQSFIFRPKGLFGIIFLTLKDKKTPDGLIHLEASDIKKFSEIEKSAYSTVKHASRNIEEILTTISGKPIDKTNFTYHSANEFAQIAKAEFGYRSSSHMAKVRLDLKSDFILKADESLLLSVLFNLMKNSFDFLPKKPTMEIIIGTETVDSHNILYVYDTGVGIPADVIQNKLFKPDYTSGKANGTGLGLWSCRRIIQAFGGDIACHSKTGEYTKFSLMFPTLSKEESRQAHEVIWKRQVEREQENLLSS